MATVADHDTAVRSSRPSGPVRGRRGSARSALGGGAYHTLSTLLALAFLFPLVWALLNSVKPRSEANQQPPTWFPHSLSLQNYINLSDFGEGIATYALNSIVVSALTVAGTVVVCVLVATGSPDSSSGANARSSWRS